MHYPNLKTVVIVLLVRLWWRETLQIGEMSTAVWESHTSFFMMPTSEIAEKRHLLVSYQEPDDVSATSWSLAHH
jgi:hypothetical protein